MTASERRTALQIIPYGLYVVGVTHGASTLAYTANWISQCSFEPPLVMMGVKRDSRSRRVLGEGGVFSINIVGSEDQEMAAFFTRAPSAEGESFGDYRFERGATGAPLLLDALAALDCRVTAIHEGGDHSIVVGEIVGAKVRGKGRPLTMQTTGWKYAG